MLLSHEVGDKTYKDMRAKEIGVVINLPNLSLLSLGSTFLMCLDSCIHLHNIIYKTTNPFGPRKPLDLLMHMSSNNRSVDRSATLHGTIFQVQVVVTMACVRRRWMNSTQIRRCQSEPKIGSSGSDRDNRLGSFV